MSRMLLLTVLLSCLATPALAGQGLVPATLEWGENSVEGDEGLTIEERRKIQQQLKVRRTMMNTHQVLSFVSAGSIIAAEIVGLVNDISLEHGDPKRADLEGSLAMHRVFAGVALTTYLGAGILAWTAPPALRLHDKSVGKGKFDSGTLHVVLSVIHGIAMGTVIATGILQANVLPASPAWEGVVVAHEIAGFTASGVIIAAGITIGTL